MKKQIRLLAYTLALMLGSLSNANAQLFINEFMASNGSTIADEAGDFEDWIEIYNAGASAINLAGYYMSDDASDPLQWQIPADNASLTTVPAGGYLLLWADKDPGANHLDFKLGSGGEDIVLVAPDGLTIIDQYTFVTQFEDVAFGRTEDGGANWDFFGEPTPGATNDTDPGAPKVANPVFSIAGGFYSGNVAVSLSTSTEDAAIHYTLDGSKPSESDAIYNGPITITANTPLRARAFLSPLVPSDIKTETYLFDIDHTFPVVSYTADPEDLFDPETGMYTNFEEDIEINVNVEMFEPDGTLGFNQLVESEINGSGSASADQKSLALKAKGSLGSATIDHQVFPLFEENEYRSLILRNSGQDNNITMFRDAMASSLVLDISDVNGTRPTITEPEIFGQAYRPGVSYINGEYWGILNIRERTDKRYIKVRFGLDDNEIDFLENNNEVREGDLVAWDELTDFLADNSLSSASNFQFVDDRVDMSHYIDYLAFNIYIDNSDWPGNNIRRFRERVSDSQWRWLTYDLDFSFGLFVRGQSWNSGFNDANALERLLTLNGFSWPNPDYSTLLFRKLMENDAWRTRFVNRMADQLNVLYNKERVINRIDAFEAEYTPEMEQHIDRWVGFLNWSDKVQRLRNFANGRADNVRNHFVSEIDEINGTSSVTINLNSANQGEVEWNTISIHEENAPFSGIYFEGVDIPVTAYPNRGFVLESWSGALSGNSPQETININNNTTITANFALGSTATERVVINEIHYNSSDALDSDDWIELYNPNAVAVDISGWYFEDESERYFSIPANTSLSAGAYLVLAETDKFSTIYPQVTNVIGYFGNGPRGFGLSGGGERLTLKNANGVLIDEVEYDDKSPWPEAADGDGPSLQLISPSLDNALAASWEAIPTTPGRLNGTNNAQDQTINFPGIANQLTTNAPFSISATASSGLAVNFIILSGPATLAGNTITLTGTPGTVTVQANQAGNTDWNPAPSILQSFNVSESPVVTGEYCDAQGDMPWSEWIAGVRLNDLDNPSGKSQYSDFTSLSTTLNAGAAYDITLSAGYSWATFNEHFNVWIDYNQNGVFESPGELAFSGIVSDVPNGTENGSISGAINVPANANTGFTRMRIAMQRGAFASACGSFPNGEVEDYTVQIGAGNEAVLSVNCLNDIERTANPGQNNAIVNWGAPEASTTCPAGLVSINQTSGPTSGSSFAVGSTTTITYTIADQCGNNQSCSFTVVINAGNSGSISLDCPSDIVITAASGQNGATINWNEPVASSTCPNGGLSVTQVGGAPNGAFFSVGNYQIAYAANDGCSNAASCTFNISVLAAPNGGDYCESSSGFPWEDWISNVQVNTINNASSKTKYSDFTDISTTLIPSSTYPITLTTSFSWMTYDEYWKVWIDYNQNGIFESPGELAYSGTLAAPPNGTERGVLNGAITVPNNTVGGQTRMRVIMSHDPNTGPCGVFEFGEVEDYTVKIPNNINAGGHSQMALSSRGDFDVFPNPASDELTIVLQTEQALEAMEIFNVASQKIEHLKSEEGKRVYRLDVRSWKEGLYFVQMNLKNGQKITQRFVVDSKL